MPPTTHTVKVAEYHVVSYTWTQDSVGTAGTYTVDGRSNRATDQAFAEMRIRNGLHSDTFYD